MWQVPAFPLFFFPCCLLSSFLIHSVRQVLIFLGPFACSFLSARVPISSCIGYASHVTAAGSLEDQLECDNKSIKVINHPRKQNAANGEDLMKEDKSKEWWTGEWNGSGTICAFRRTGERVVLFASIPVGCAFGMEGRRRTSRGEKSQTFSHFLYTFVCIIVLLCFTYLPATDFKQNLR